MAEEIDTQVDTPQEVIPSKELKILYTWKSPARLYKKRDKEFWSTIFAIVFLVGLILLFVHEWLLVAAIISLTFVYYILSTVEPEEIEHKISNRGLIYAGETYPWEVISRFWFSEKYGSRLVNLEIVSGMPNRLTLLVGNGQEKTIREILLKYIIEETVPPNFLDKAADWLQEKVPLEEEKSATASNKISSK